MTVKSAVPDCPDHKTPMELVEFTDKILTFKCEEKGCKKTVDVLRIGVNRDDPILKRIKGFKDIL